MRLTPSGNWSLRVLCVLGLAALSGPARAQDIATAEALFTRGVADMDAGKYDTGCKAIAESQRLDPRPGTLFTLATCEARWGRIATAVARFTDYLALYDRLPDDRRALQGERPTVATEQRAKLTPEVPQLTLSLPKGAPAGTVVKRDGELVAEAALGINLPVDPGDHTVSTTTPGGGVWEQRFTIARGEKKQLTLEVKAEVKPGPVAPSATATSSAAVTAPSAGPSTRRVVTYVVGGAGLLGLAAGGLLFGLAAAQKGTIDQHCGAGIGLPDDTACDPTGLNAANSTKGLGMGSTVALAVGAAAVGTAVVLFLTEPKANEPGKSARVAGVLSLGPGAATLGVQGAW